MSDQLLDARREAATWLGEVRRLQIQIDALRAELETWKQLASRRAGEIMRLRARVADLERAVELPPAPAKK